MTTSRIIDGLVPETADGRNIDAQLGELAGAGAGIRVKRPETAFPLPDASRPLTPEANARAVMPSYYGLPALKQPVWKGWIPMYFYTGAIAGGAAVLGAAAQLAGGRELEDLVRRCRWLSTGATALSAALLIADLGVPRRFINMLRVFRPTSPMNVGTFVVSALGASSGAAALLARRRGTLGALGDAAGLAAGLAGLPMSGYTAVLLSSSAVPVWKHAARTLPFLFVASAAASTAAILQLLPPRTSRERRTVRTFALIGGIAEVAGMVAVERSLPVPVRRPLQRGTSGLLWRASKAAAVASIALDLLPGRRRPVRVASGLLETAAALGIRFALLHAGRASARDPHAVFAPQRDAMARAGAPLSPARPRPSPAHATTPAST